MRLIRLLRTCMVGKQAFFIFPKLTCQCNMALEHACSSPHIVGFSSSMWYGTVKQHVTHCYALLRIVTYLRGTCWRHGRFELEFHAELRDVGHLGGYSREMGDLQWPVGPGVVVPGPSGADKRSWRRSKCTSRQCKRSCLGGDGLATRAAGGRVESKRSIEETFGDAGCNSQWWHQSYEAGLAQTSLQHHSRKAVVRAGFAIIRIARNSFGLHGTSAPAEKGSEWPFSWLPKEKGNCDQQCPTWFN